jgi:Flp pilus assembly protein TadD
MQRMRAAFLGLLLAFGILSSQLRGAQKLDQAIGRGLSTIEKQQWLITGQVRSLAGGPISNPRIHIRYAAEGIAENTLNADVQGRFNLTLELDSQAYRTLSVTVSAEKEGFLPSRETVNFTKKGETFPIDLVMRPGQEDGAALSQNQLLSALAPRYQAASPAELKAEGTRQDFARGVGLLFEQHDYVKAVPLLSAVAKKSAPCVECRTVLGLAELQAGSIASAQQEFAEAVLAKLSAAEESRKVNALIVLGVLAGWSAEYPKAAGLLMQALRLAPQDAVALEELGRTLVNQKNWEAADDYLQQAEKSGASPEARLLRCRAVLEEGDAPEAEAEMRAYLAGRNIRTLPPPTRALYTQVQSQLSLRAYKRENSLVNESLPELLKQQPGLAGLEPAADESPLDAILQKTGANVEAFFKNFQNATSRERIEEEQIGKGGKVKRSLEQQFQYLLITTPYQGGLSLDEFRTNPKGTQTGPAGLSDGFMLTVGFASASLVFHPAYQGGAKYRYLGRARMEGTDCDVVAFAQDPAKAKMFGRFSTHSATALVLHQGIAWIDPRDARIVRLRTDLLEPLPKVRLQRETTEILYSQVSFKDIPAPVSLPAQVTVTVEWKGKTFRNLHQYTDFRLFNTTAQEKRQARQPPSEPSPKPN